MPRSNPHWENPGGIIAASARSYNVNRWLHQNYHVEVFVEKEALSGVIESVCRRNDVVWFACRGYVSDSAMYQTAQRIMRACRDNGGEYLAVVPVRSCVILYLGDHDPSGVHMPVDIQERLDLFCQAERFPLPTVKRIALTMDQIEQYAPPPNPAKETDSRFAAYAAEYGDESWELDSLDPVVIQDLIEEEILDLRNDDVWHDDTAAMEDDRAVLVDASRRWDEVTDFLKNDA